MKQALKEQEAVKNILSRTFKMIIAANISKVRKPPVGLIIQNNELGLHNPHSPTYSLVFVIVKKKNVVDKIVI